MNECEQCRADKIMCQYCIYKDKKNDNQDKQDNDIIIYFNTFV